MVGLILRVWPGPPNDLVSVLEPPWYTAWPCVHSQCQPRLHYIPISYTDIIQWSLVSNGAGHQGEASHSDHTEPSLTRTTIIALTGASYFSPGIEGAQTPLIWFHMTGLSNTPLYLHSITYSPRHCLLHGSNLCFLLYISEGPPALSRGPPSVWGRKKVSTHSYYVPPATRAGL